MNDYVDLWVDSANNMFKEVPEGFIKASDLNKVNCLLQAVQFWPRNRGWMDHGPNDR